MPNSNIPDDPAFWSVERVVQELCYTETKDWANTGIALPLPRPDEVENAFRTNDVDGDVLLQLEGNDFDTMSLRSIGQIKKLKRLIHNLRSHSQRYIEIHGEPFADGMSRSIERSIPSHSRTPETNFAHASTANYAAYTNTGVPQPLATNGVIRSVPAAAQPSSVDLQSFSGQQSTPHWLHNTPKEENNMLDIISRNIEVQQSQNQSGSSAEGQGSIINSVVSNKRYNENNDQDNRKRQRFTSQPGVGEDLLRSYTLRDGDKIGRGIADGDAEFPESIEDPLPLARHPFETATSQPLHQVTSNRIQSTIELSGTSVHTRPAFNEMQKLQATPAKDDREVFDLQNTASLLNQEALSKNSLAGLGVRKQQPRRLAANLLERIDGPGKIPDLLIDRSERTNVAVTDWPSSASNSEEADDSSEAELDDLGHLQALLVKYPVDEENAESPLPTYGQSDEEDRYTIVQTSSPEPMNSPKVEKQHTSLQPEQVDALINEAIQEYIEDWKLRKLPKLHKRAYEKWVAASELPDAKIMLLNAAKKDYNRIMARLPVLRMFIHDTIWTNAADLKKQCECLQPTVDLREECLYFVRVLENDERPTSPALAALQRPWYRAEKSVDEISCDSDDDTESQEPASRFVVLDEGDAQGNSLHTNTELNRRQEDVENFDVHVNAQNTSEGRKDSLTGNEAIAKSARQVLPHTPERQILQDDYRGEADDEDDQPPVSSRRHATNARKRAAVESRNRNPLPIPDHTDPSDNDEDSDLDRPPRGTRSETSTHGATESQPIVLSSPNRSDTDKQMHDYDIRTPDLNPTDIKLEMRLRDTGKAVSPEIDGIEPDNDIPRLSEVENIPWDVIETNPHDHVLGLAKAVSEAKLAECKALERYVLPMNIDDMKDILKDGITVVKSDIDLEIDVQKRDQRSAMLMTGFFISYACGCRAYDETISEEVCDTTWNYIESDASVFQDALLPLLRQQIRRRSLNQSSFTLTSAEESTGYTSFDTATEVETNLGKSRKGSKRRSHKLTRRRSERSSDEAALDTQLLAHQRVRDQQMRKAKIDRMLANEKSGSDVWVPVNFKEPLVFLDQHIARRIKPHQKSGLQFLWRELIEDARHEGCLLAHTMGLGKTMQVISVLVTIAQCIKSSNSQIAEYIPPHLRSQKILILSPPSLTENWYDELVFWMPDAMTLGPLYKITNRSRLPYYDIKQWAESGGVLLIGYDRLVSYTRVPTKCQGDSDGDYNNKLIQHENMIKWLFEHPSMVVADEAHMLKNPLAKRAITAMRIKTKSRIALTGSPLSNHLEEYWSMIEFIAPGYLGDLLSFRSKFVAPINRCLSVESSSYERRSGLKKMHVLRKILAPKVDRADITAIQSDLPMKTEFFITVPLTQLQLAMYKACVHYWRGAVSEGGFGRGQTASLWQWISILSLLCNHPWTFDVKLKDPQRKLKKKSKFSNYDPEAGEDDENADDGQRPDDIDVVDQPGMLEVIKQALVLCQGILTDQDIEDPSLSYRSVLIKAIVEQSILLGEKVLVFSHSLWTLDYMEYLLNDLKCPFERIDGGVATDKRQQAAKNFNAAVGVAKVFLISTRAGGLGLNLQGATRVILWDYSFNPSWEEQAIGRSYRLGQTKPVFVYRFRSGGTYEDVTFNQTIFKTQLFTRVIDHKAVLRKGSKNDTQKYLFDPKSPQFEDLSECHGKDPQVMDKIMAQNKCICSIVLTETFAQDIQEELTAEEEAEADRDVEDEKLARENPERYQLRLAKRSAESHRHTVATTQSRSSQPPSSTQYSKLLSNTLNGPGLASTQPGISSPLSNRPPNSTTPNLRSSFGDEISASSSLRRQPNTVIIGGHIDGAVDSVEGYAERQAIRDGFDDSSHRCRTQ